jgi:hypothetical protein
MTKITTEPGLLLALEAAAKKRLTVAEIHQQRIDYIVGSLTDEGTVVTRAQVAQELGKFSGVAA